MSWISIVAIYFIIWWVVLFAILPIGVRSQIEDDNVTLGTDHGAPAKPALLRKMLLTTVISLIVFGIFYVLTSVLGYSANDLPRIVPHFEG
ncbi:MAG: DUF1467 family protein [Oricola sp.]